MPSLLRTSAGTEIWPCAVTLDCGFDTQEHYHGNANSSKTPNLRIFGGDFNWSMQHHLLS
jgi:hypothetical protein